MLTQAGTTGTKLNGDWIFGFSHPTATVHASLAERLFNINATSTGSSNLLENGMR
jgi:hypothetical protein